MGVAAGDYDNDGDIDLYVTNLGSNVLLRNDGAGRFTDVTVKAGVGDPGWGTAATFLDLDNDGDLDLFCRQLPELDPRIGAGLLCDSLSCHVLRPQRIRCSGDGPPVSKRRRRHV